MFNDVVIFTLKSIIKKMCKGFLIVLLKPYTSYESKGNSGNQTTPS